MLEGERKTRALIKYLKRNASDFYSEQFAVDGELSERRSSYNHGKSILSSQFGTWKDSDRILESVQSLKPCPNQSLEDVLEIAAKSYGAAGSKDEQIFVLFSEATLVDEDLQKRCGAASPNYFSRTARSNFAVSSVLFMISEDQEGRDVLVKTRYADCLPTPNSNE